MAINQIHERNGRLNLKISDIIKLLKPIFRSRYFYFGLISVIAGTELNFASQTYLYNNFDEGKTLPLLSDLILDNLPLYNVSLFYDLFSFIPIIILLIYIVHKNDYNRIPFFLVMCGIIEIVRGIFIILTPFGNPPMFPGSNALFSGFSKY